ncbi:MAG: Asp-tRNA(Asn)/Glu-tRNA(Gln) amidotransferase subunit GatB [Acidimicrobiales bacterium]
MSLGAAPAPVPTGAPPAPARGWETVVGLEVHCELSTATKAFCSCRAAFGDEPNTNVCPVCLGLPGSLPVLNKMAVELAIRVGVALHCDVEPSIFHRKNYFYPDMPKDYQISQYDAPINVGGWLELPDGARVGIERAHMEEDTGKSTHVGAGGRIHDANYSLVDYNRAGVPLVEIVSRPDIRSAAQARAYVNELRGILVATGASDGKMEEGSVRVDANVSVRRAGTEALGTRCEVKNLNSLRSLGHAVDFEAARQVELLESGGRVVQETRHWDEGAGCTHPLRSKEEAFDYRYFPEPDLVPLTPEPEWVASVAASLPPMPAERRSRLRALDGLADPALNDRVATVVELGLDALVVGAAGEGADPLRALNLAANELAADTQAAQSLDQRAFVELVAMASGQPPALSATQAKAVLAEMLESGGRPAEIARRRGFQAMASDKLAAALDAAVASSPEQWARYVAGEDKVAGFFVGEVMRATSGRADGKAVTALLRSRRSAGLA